MLAENLNRLKCQKTAQKFNSQKSSNPLLQPNKNPHFLSCRKKDFISKRCELTFHKERITDYRIHHFSIQDFKLRQLPAALIETHQIGPKTHQLSRKSTQIKLRSFPPIESRSTTQVNLKDTDRFYIPIDKVSQLKVSKKQLQFKQLAGVHEILNSARSKDTSF